MTKIDPSSNKEPKTVLIESAHLRTVMEALFTRLSVPPNEVTVVVDTLMEASLAGYNSHGVMRVPMYVEGIQQGTMVPGAEMGHVRETAASVYLDGACGLGPVAATNAMRLATEKASQSGVGCVSVVNCNDLARLGSYVIEPAQNGFISMLMVNDGGSGPAVAPWGGVQPFLSTNPLAVGIPWKAETPVVIDISTSIVAAGQLKTLAAKGETAPDGWLIDQDGLPSQDLDGFLAAAQKSALLPLGGLMAGHKGFALGLVVDILAGALSGAGCSTGEMSELERNGLFVLAIDPEQFVSRSEFQGHVDRFLVGIKESRKAPGVDEIYIPGERAAREKARQLREGVSVPATVWERVLGLAEEFGL